MGSFAALLALTAVGAASASARDSAPGQHGRGSKPHLFLMVLVHLSAREHPLQRGGAAALIVCFALHVALVQVVDDLGWNNVGWHNKEMKTPHSDRLLREGVELDRNYVFMYCSPTRSSILSGRLPHHVNQINLDNSNVGEGIPAEMTIIAKKLSHAGYRTHMVGKWHCGCAEWAQIPMSKGFDTSLHYFAGAEDHWTQGSCIDQLCNAPDPEKQHKSPVDLWDTNKPAWGMNNTMYGGYLYNKRVLDTIAAHDKSTPLFCEYHPSAWFCAWPGTAYTCTFCGKITDTIDFDFAAVYIAFQQNHEPLEAPSEFIDRYPQNYNVDRLRYAGMTSFWDESVGNITAALKDNDMYNDSLIVLTGDNGGPVYWTLSKYAHGAGANNYPLFGGKVSNWEGGIRVAGFVSGGALPPSARGTKLEQFIHGCDWFATFCALANVSKADPVAVAHGFADVDSLDMWPLLTGAVHVSPRTEIPAAIEFENKLSLVNVTAIIDSE